MQLLNRIGVLCAAVVCLASVPCRAAGTSVMLADGQTLDKVTLKPGADKEQLTLERTGQPPTTVSIQDLLVVDFGKLRGRALTPSVRFVNGDTVYGKVSFPAPRQVKVSGGWGSVTAPLAWCAAIRLQEKASLLGVVDKDTLVLANDRVEGEVDSIANGKINFKLAGKPVPVDVARVASIGFKNRKAGAERGTGLLMSVDLGGGERVTGKWVSITQDVLTIRAEWGDQLEIPVASVARLEVKNGKLVYLSDLPASEVKITPFLDGSYTFGQDRTLSGRPLRLGGKTYARGLGTHSRSEITYALDGGFQTFSATLGIDDSVGAVGSVIYRVYGDDKVLFESPIVRGGDAPIDLKLPIKGVLLLRLEVDFADAGDAADQADWADARLLRP